ncbi:MAG: hypothetical protein AAGJ40_09755 [Planctomycetota bacterium]
MRTVAETERIANQFFEEQGEFIRRERIETPEMIGAAYDTGALIGAVTDSEELPHDLRQFARNCRDEFRAEVGRSEYRFSTASGTGGMYGDYDGQLIIHYQHYLNLDPRMAFKGAQLTGDCVSWSKRSMRDQARCFDIGHLDQAEEYVKRSATADLYSMRGHTGAGASPSRIANAATKIGILLENPLESPDGEVWDFSDYKQYYKWGMEYGRTGFPRWIYEANADFGPKQVAEIHTDDEFLTALWNGCGLGLGSMMGVSKTGGKDGVPFLSALSGSWAHDMHVLGADCRRKYHREVIVLMDQSWGGRWNRISQWPDEYKVNGMVPEGMFAITLTDFMRHVRRGECHALSDSHGFRPRRQATIGFEGLI